MNDISNEYRKKTFRVGIYLRLSNEDRDKISKDELSESIKNQRNMLTQYISMNPEFILVDEYCDEDLSGAGTYRPEFERLIKDCENNKLDIVLCKSQSRFSRDMEIVERYINNKFREWNVRFIGLSDNADTDNFGNKKARQINGLVNEWYLEDVSNNIRSAFNTKMRQGEFISPFASFGYEINLFDNNKLIIDPVASVVVRSIYNLYLTGLGFTNIANYLNSNNIPSPSLYKFQKGIKLNINSKRPREEIKWTANSIKTILTNELYIGNLIQGKRTTVSYKNHKIRCKDKTEWIRVKNTHEPIIDEDTFNKVQIALKERSRSIKSTGIVHIFSGKVFCLECNCCMRKKSSGKHEYLVCSSCKDGYNNCLNKSSIRYDTLESIILDEINNIVGTYYDSKLIENEFRNSRKNKFTSIILYLERQILDINNKISNIRNYIKTLYEDKVDGVITNEQFKYLADNYKKNEALLVKKISFIDNEIKLYKNKEKSLNNYKEIINKYIYFKELNKIIIDEFIDKIYIGKINKSDSTRCIKVIWNFL